MKQLPVLIIIICAASTYTWGQTMARLDGLINNHDLFISDAAVTLLKTPLTATTNASGEFQISDIPVGTYTLHIVAEGYADVLQKISLSPGDNVIKIALEKREKQLDEVVVSADKSKTDMQSLPLSLTVLSARDINESQIWDIRDLTAIIPGMYASHPGDLRNVVSIRGMTTSSYDPAVATYVDGVNQFSLDTYISQLHDIERIEVLRGPQGTLYGRNATGGVINIITKQPDTRTRGRVEVSFGNYGLQRYSGSLQSPFLSDKLLFGVAGILTQRNGIYTNVFSQESYDDMKLFQGNYFAKYKHNEKFSLQLNLKHQHHRNDGAFPLVMGDEEAFDQPFELDQNAQSTMNDRTFNASLTASYQSQRHGLSSQTSYQDNHRIYKNSIDGDFSSYDIVAIVNDYGKEWNRSRVWMHETRLHWRPHGDKIDWNFGIYGFLQKAPAKQGTYYGDDAEMYGVPMRNFTDISVNKLMGRGFAGFSQMTYQISPKFSLIGGLRYDYEYKRQNIAGLFDREGEPSITTLPDTSASAHFTDLSPKLALTYSWHENRQLYSTYSQGFRAGGISTLSSDPSAPPLMTYEPEQSTNFEIGSKNMLLNKKLRLNVALFYTKVTNGQVPVLVMPEALTMIRNTAQLSSKGVELEMSALFSNLEVDYSFGYTDAYYTDLITAQNESPTDLSRNKQIFTPNTTSFLRVQYIRNISRKAGNHFFARVEHKLIGKQYFDLANSISQEKYNLLSARMGIRYRKIEVAFWGANLTNTHYISYAYDFGAIHLGTPRTYGVSLKTAL